MAVGAPARREGPASDGRGKNYKWIALSNTTLGILMVTINQSILLISLPDLFRGIKLNPLLPSNTSRMPVAAKRASDNPCPIAWSQTSR